MYALAWVIFLNQQEEVKWEISLVLEPTKHFWTVNIAGHYNKGLLELKKQLHKQNKKGEQTKKECTKPEQGEKQNFLKGNWSFWITKHYIFCYVKYMWLRPH